MMTFKKGPLLWPLLLVFLAACQKEKRSNFRLDRFLDAYNNAGRRKPIKAEIDEALKERLRALGYIR